MESQNSNQIKKFTKNIQMIMDLFIMKVHQ